MLRAKLWGGVLIGVLVLVGCGGGSGDSQNLTPTAEENITGTVPATEQNGTDASEVLDPTGRISVYTLKRTPTSLLAETRVESEAGIKKITLYCIDAYKLFEQDKLLVLEEYSKEYDPETTKVEFFQHLFEGLYEHKSYVIKAVAETGAGVLHQMLITATLPYPRLKESLDLSPYDVYHPTEPVYQFDLPEPTRVDAVQFEEFDGDEGLFNFYLKTTDGRVITVATDVVSSGNGVAKTHYFTNPEPDAEIASVIIETKEDLGGMWQLDALIINP